MEVYVKSDLVYGTNIITLLSDPSTTYPSFEFNAEDADSVDFSSLTQATIDVSYGATPSFYKNYANESSLAEALAAFGLSSMTRHQNYTGDMNDIKGNAWGYTGSGATNTPSELNSSMSFISLAVWWEAPIQIAVSDNGFAVRRFLYNNWSQWTVVMR